MVSAPKLLPPDIPTEPACGLSVDAYHALVDSGHLGEDAPVELLEGWLIPKMTRKPPHAAATRKLREALRALLPAGYFVDSQDPLTTADSEPEPDVVVIRGAIEDYESRHPGPQDTPLVAEIADTSLGRDRGLMRRIYARAGIASYWIVNLVDRQVEIHTVPTGIEDRPAFHNRMVFVEGESVPLVVDGAQLGSIAVSDILPRIAP